MNESIRNWFDWRGWVVLLSAIAVVLGVAAILSPGLREFIANSTTAAWASAASTFLAAAAALAIAGADGRRRRHDQRVNAALYAAHLAPRLRRYATAIQPVSAVADFYETDDNDLLSRMRKDLERVEIEIDMDQLLHLVPLDRAAAHRLARGLTLANIALTDIRSTQDPKAVSNAVAKVLAQELWTAANLIVVATEVCEKLATQYATDPTGEEIYGEP